jgi:2-desacetyl-2-hydroxyethyl bacteriochlorophyllide A dehydrogenase
MPDTYPMAMVTRPGVVEYVDKPIPELGPTEAMIEIKAAAICGSDLHVFKGRHPSAALPAAVGHEIAGEVVEIGGEVSLVKPGDRVTVEPLVVCDACFYCQRGQYHRCQQISLQYREGQGGFGRYFKADQRWLHRLPDGLSYTEGALIEPLSVAVHAVKLARLPVNASCAVFGDGAIGLLVSLVLKASGAGVIYLAGIQKHRLDLAEQLGADATINNLGTDVVGDIYQLTAGMGVDRSFEAVGIQSTLVQSLRVLRKGGTAVLLGIFEEPGAEIPANLFIQREISLVGSHAYNWDFQIAIQLVERGAIPLKKLITHTLPMDSLQEGFELLLDPANNAVKVVLVN